MPYVYNLRHHLNFQNRQKKSSGTKVDSLIISWFNFATLKQNKDVLHIVFTFYATLHT